MRFTFPDLFVPRFRTPNFVFHGSTVFTLLFGSCYNFGMKTTLDWPGLRTIPVGFWSVILLGVFAWAPATYPGYWQATEGFIPVFNATHTEPLAHIATQPDFWRGTGGDAFLLARPLLLLGASPAAAVRFSFAIALILGGLGVYVWLNPRLGEWAAALSALLYMFFPPVLGAVYIRGSISDAMIAGLLPMALAGVAIFARSRSRSAVLVTVIAVIWMWRTQPGLALLVTLLLMLYGWFVEQHWRSVLMVGVSAVAGLLSRWPVLSVRDDSLVLNLVDFGLLHQLVDADWAAMRNGHSAHLYPPTQLGVAVIVLGVLTFWQWWYVARRQPDSSSINRLLLFCFVGGLVMTGLTLTISAPLWEWTGGGRLLRYPWQLHLLAAPLLAVSAGALPAVSSSFARPAVWSTLITLVVVSSYGLLSADFTQTPPPDRPIAVFGPRHNIAILSMDLVETSDPPQATLYVTWQSLEPLAFDYNVFFQAQAGDLQAPEIIAQLDAQPLGGQRPATSWRPGEILTDTYRLDWLEQPSEVGLRYVFGYYDWRDGTRLLRDGNIDDKLILYGR